jgi:hypothetical protein
MAIASEGDCPGHPGFEESVLAGKHFYFAVLKNMQLVEASAFRIAVTLPKLSQTHLCH